MPAQPMIPRTAMDVVRSVNVIFIVPPPAMYLRGQPGRGIVEPADAQE
jgi:hypothetical protein